MPPFPNDIHSAGNYSRIRDPAAEEEVVWRDDLQSGTTNLTPVRPTPFVFEHVHRVCNTAFRDTDSLWSTMGQHRSAIQGYELRRNVMSCAGLYFGMLQQKHDDLIQSEQSVRASLTSIECYLIHVPQIIPSFNAAMANLDTIKQELESRHPRDLPPPPSVSDEPFGNGEMLEDTSIASLRSTQSTQRPILSPAAAPYPTRSLAMSNNPDVTTALQSRPIETLEEALDTIDTTLRHASNLQHAIQAHITRLNLTKQMLPWHDNEYNSRRSKTLMEEWKGLQSSVKKLLSDSIDLRYDPNLRSFIDAATPLAASLEKAFADIDSQAATCQEMLSRIRPATLSLIRSHSTPHHPL